MRLQEAKDEHGGLNTPTYEPVRRGIQESLDEIKPKKMGCYFCDYIGNDNSCQLNYCIDEENSASGAG